MAAIVNGCACFSRNSNSPIYLKLSNIGQNRCLQGDLSAKSTALFGTETAKIWVAMAAQLWQIKSLIVAKP
jgi:hypothetical protein